MQHLHFCELLTHEHTVEDHAYIVERVNHFTNYSQTIHLPASSGSFNPIGARVYHFHAGFIIPYGTGMEQNHP